MIKKTALLANVGFPKSFSYNYSFPLDALSNPHIRHVMLAFVLQGEENFQRSVRWNDVREIGISQDIKFRESSEQLQEEKYISLIYFCRELQIIVKVRWVQSTKSFSFLSCWLSHAKMTLRQSVTLKMKYYFSL